MVQSIKQNRAGIRNIPGTVLKNAITGETIYTPPCCEDVLREKLAALEAYIHVDQPDDPDPLVKMCLIHYQFEAIHPFAGGNGRTGRMLNTLYLVQQGLLTEPVLFLSGYILQHKKTYYSLLNAVTEEGQWQDWILYILTAIEETSKLTAGLIRDIIALKNHTEKELQRVLGASYDHELLQLMFKQPYLKIELIEKSGIAHRQTASTWLKKMTAAGLVRPLKRGRTTYFINHRLMEALK
jgi:Fic family protein